MNKEIFALSLALATFLIIPIATSDVNVTVDVVTAPPPEITFIKSNVGLLLGASAIVWLVRTWIYGTGIKSKIDLFIYGAIVFIFTVSAIAVILSL